MSFSKDTKGAVNDKTGPLRHFSLCTAYCTVESCIWSCDSWWRLYYICRAEQSIRCVPKSDGGFMWSFCAPPRAAAPLPQGFGMFGPRSPDHCGVVQPKPQRCQRLNGTGEPWPGWPRHVVPPAAGEGQAVSWPGPHRIRGETPKKLPSMIQTCQGFSWVQNSWRPHRPTGVIHSQWLSLDIFKSCVITVCHVFSCFSSSVWKQLFNPWMWKMITVWKIIIILHRGVKDVVYVKQKARETTLTAEERPAAV